MGQSSSDLMVLTFTMMGPVTSLGLSLTSLGPSLTRPGLITSLDPHNQSGLITSLDPHNQSGLQSNYTVFSLYWAMPHYWYPARHILGHASLLVPGTRPPWVHHAPARHRLVYSCCSTGMLRVATGLQTEPFTRQLSDLHQRLDIMDPGIDPVWTQYLNGRGVPYRRDSGFDRFDQYLLLTVL